jgi:hypothetical protein
LITPTDLQNLPDQKSYDIFNFYNFAFWSIAIYMATIIGITLFISEISDNIGQGVLKNFVTTQQKVKKEVKKT